MLVWSTEESVRFYFIQILLSNLLTESNRVDPYAMYIATEREGVGAKERAHCREQAHKNVEKQYTRNRLLMFIVCMKGKRFRKHKKHHVGRIATTSLPYSIQHTIFPMHTHASSRTFNANYSGIPRALRNHKHKNAVLGSRSQSFFVWFRSSSPLVSLLSRVLATDTPIESNATNIFYTAVLRVSTVFVYAVDFLCRAVFPQRNGT